MERGGRALVAIGWAVWLLAGCVAQATVAPSGAPSPVPSAGPLSSGVTGLQGYLDSLSAPAFTGVVVVAKDFTPIASRAVGLADRGTVRAIALDTSFDVGSLGKLLTAVAVGQLVESGKVRLDDPIGQYVSGLSPETASTVTIRELLGHRAGTGDFLTDPGYVRSKDTIKSVRDLLGAINLRAPLLFPPGSSWAYSNTGYALLGRVIEQASGEDYYAYIARHILSIGMSHAGFYEKTDLPPFAAIGYDPSGASNSGTLGLRGSPAGGVYASAADLIGLHRAWHDGHLLDAATSAEITALLAPPPPPGASLRPTGQLPDGLFAGGEPGANAVLGLLDASQTTLVVLANGSPPMAEDVADQLRPYLATP